MNPRPWQLQRNLSFPSALAKGNFVVIVETMRRRANSKADLNFPPIRPKITYPSSHAITENVEELTGRLNSGGSTVRDSSVESVSVLLPDWEVLMIVSPGSVVNSGERLWCLYANNATSKAIFAGVLPSTNQTTFKCWFPESARRRKMFLQPVLLTRSPEKEKSSEAAPIMIKWRFMAYESFSTEDDVVLFVKGVNNRQGINRSPSDFKCVFGNNGVKTAVTSSTQEVFRCPHPNLTEVDSGGDDERLQIKVSLEISGENLVVPSVAYYTPPSTIALPRRKSLLCACTMVYNAAKFLREWVTYHSKIGVDRFILYDNDSDDDLQTVVKDLNQEGYAMETLLWIWPKTQEAGFSHGAVYVNDSCTWMMYTDVDEFIFAPNWNNSEHPSDQMLKSLLPDTAKSSSSKQRHHHHRIGQVSFSCNEFGPSDQKQHPVEGVTQGYTCRRQEENRHKSIVLLDAIDHSLLNVIHHFGLKENYRSKQVRMEVGLVNHYKYQTWPEFKSKFRRRVSAYVVDWRKASNPNSKDRTPGLGFEPIEPKGWAHKFCEVRDERLKLLTQAWFGNQTSNGLKMAWQR
ncbi:glycosyltransferase family 92 protein RCOM_0530710-like [Tripterygium wilfordii]|uniref:glycosyltransferase family 92 protein RCOM_0530710-like n=1 Tax=Tripterygium wilfordii TaxID=458696 RepID=UPI0018F80ED7|nr:glycosyltransferase family 92 protein RCOM_0530710-like [Tripterygium wilfordii]